MLAPHIQRGHAIPAKIADRPEIAEGFELYWSAYLDLVSERTENNKIPWRAAREWATYHELDPDQFEILKGVLFGLDQTYIGWKASKTKTK